MIGYHFIIVPVYDDTKLIKAEYESLLEIFKDSQELADIRDSILSDYSVISENEIEELNKVIPYYTNSEVLLFLKEIENIGITNGKGIVFGSYNVKFNDQIETVTESGNYVLMKISLSVPASYSSIKALLQEMYNNNRIMFPTRLAIVNHNPNEDEGSDIDIWNIEIGTYFRKTL